MAPAAVFVALWLAPLFILQLTAVGVNILYFV
jgi:hypothetical protein